MNLTGHSERNRKPDVYFQSVRAALPSNVLSTNVQTYGTSRHLVNTNTLGYKGHGAQWSAVKRNSVKRPSFLRLDSQGECSRNEWFHDSSHAVSTYSSTLALFSDVLRRYSDTCGHYPKPEPVKQYCSSLSIASAVKLLCQKNDVLLQCHQKKASVAISDGAVMSQMYPLQCRLKLLPSCTSGITMQHTHPLDFVSSLQFQPEEQHNCSQELQYDFHIPYLSFSNILPVSLPYVAGLADYVSTFEQYRYQHENAVDQMSLVPFRSSADNGSTLCTKWLRHQIRQPRYNCRRRWLHVRSNTRFRTPSAQIARTDISAIDRYASNCELVHSDAGTDECSDSSHENELTSSDIRRDMSQYLSSVQESVTACDDNNAMWLSHCYSDLPLPSSLCNIPYTPLQESCSFSSLFFVSGKDMEDSDFCSTDGEESACSGLISPTSVFQPDDVLADAMLSGLPCIPFADTWVMGCFSDCTAVGFEFNSNFEIDVEEDAASVPCDYDVCQYSLGVHEANARWNEAYSFPADILFEMSQHHSKMVRMNSIHITYCDFVIFHNRFILE